MKSLPDALPIHPALRPRRLTVSGGSRLREENARFCKSLGRRLAQEPGITIITGGLKGLKANPETRSVDWSTIDGALRHLSEQNADPYTRIETLLPAEARDFADVERFEVGRTVRLYGRTPQARRFMLVNTADVVLTIEGGNGTREVIDLAMVIGKSVLPLPFTKGVSADRWHENKEEIRTWFGFSTDLMDELERVDLQNADDAGLADLAELVVRHVVKGLRRHCFVIMPFSASGNELYDSVIEEAIVELGIAPVRADRLNLTGNALDTLRHAIDNCDGALADITGNNPNVMYEIGLAHAQSKPVVIICNCSDGNFSESLPFDLRGHHVIRYDKELDALKRAIQSSLRLVFG